MSDCEIVPTKVFYLKYRDELVTRSEDENAVLQVAKTLLESILVKFGADPEHKAKIIFRQRGNTKLYHFKDASCLELGYELK